MIVYINDDPFLSNETQVNDLGILITSILLGLIVKIYFGLTKELILVNWNLVTIIFILFEMCVGVDIGTLVSF